jgi:CotH kinase protein
MRFKLVCYCLLVLWTGSAQLPASSNLPLVVIHTRSPLVFDEPKTFARMAIINNGFDRLNRPTDLAFQYAGIIGIEYRGNTSQLMSDKKPYAIELRDSLGEDLDMPLLDMPSESDWALLAPYSDKSLLRDRLGFELGARFDALRFTPRSRWVELIINGSYEGVYVLCEKVKRDKHRVAIAKNLRPDDPSGGFIVKLDKESGAIANEYWLSKYAPDNNKSGQQIRFLPHYPEPQDLRPDQMTYIQQYMNEWETALRSPNWLDPREGYRRMTDTASFVDYMLFTELLRNVDGYRISSYFYKERDSLDSRLHAGPVWDFNLCFGNADFCRGSDITGWQWEFNQVCPNDYWLVPFWWSRLWQDPQFRLAAQRRWQQLRQEALSDRALSACINALAQPLSQGAVQRNFVRWPIMGVPQWPNKFVGRNWEEELTYLQNWLLQRAAWMDKALYFP